ncbi:hypothetical protein F0U59_13745 [Archangium gephyra]|nr:hypothetical protein F0U59_13745 [Archangium gephyra]
MPDYDFRSLSSFDFECVTRDLLQKELSITLESFKAGSDGGIDLRHAPVHGGRLIVQCKHYASSSFPKLLSHLASSEVPKVRRLAPRRYILSTSLGLTPANKERLAAILQPHCLTPADIYGREDLNNLLGKFPEIERQHFKLWLSSSTILERLIHSPLYNQTDIALESIRRKIKVYVQNNSYREAMDLLESLHLCIICGIPGIGKTTLAEMLLVALVGEGYEAIKVSEDIREAFTVFKADRKQVFYYDDFLGQSNLEEKLNKNEDDRLLSFIGTVKRSKYHRFILTTREYILNQAKARYERLAQSRFDVHRCTIDLGKYTRRNRAQILFNHLYFSTLPRHQLDGFLSGDIYKRVVDHRNFNPRLVEAMTQVVDWGNSAESFGFAFLDNLENPRRLWEHAFERQLSSHARNLVLTMASLRPRALYEDLQRAFESLQAVLDRRSSTFKRPTAFREALEELDGTFITTSREDGALTVSLQNPSIGDFIQNYIWMYPEYLKALVESACFFEQIERLTHLREINRPASEYPASLGPMGYIWADAVMRTFDVAPALLVYYSRGSGSRALGRMSLNRVRRLARLIDLAAWVGASELEGVARASFEKWFEKNKAIDPWAIDPGDLMGLLGSVRSAPFAHQYATPLGEFTRQCVTGELDTIESFKNVLVLEEDFPDLVSQELRDCVREAFVDFHDNCAWDMGRDFDEEMDSYVDDLRDVGKAFKVDVERTVARLVDHVAERAADREIRQDNPGTRSPMGALNDALTTPMNDDELKALFTSLAERPPEDDQ